MTYSFIEKLIKEGNRHYIKIPFNVWEECNQKGLIPVRVYIETYIFECKLVPKGNGVYYIPIASKIINQINNSDDIDISFEIIQQLTRINHNSPYSMANPIRKIDSIQSTSYHKAGYCGQICMAMLTGLSVDEIVDIMQSNAWQCSFSKIFEILDYFGLSHNDKVIYTKGEDVTLPECCIVNVKGEPVSHMALYYKGKFYDDTSIDTTKIISYLKIDVE